LALVTVGDAKGRASMESRGGALAGFVPALPLRGCRSAASPLQSALPSRAARCARRPMATATATAQSEGAARGSEIVDPFVSTQPDMRRLKQKIKGVLERKLGSGDQAHPLLKSSSREFFERSEKTWRPMVALLLSKAFDGTGLTATEPRHHDDAMVIAEIVEIMHTSTVIHDTVLEDYEAFEKGNMAHRLYSSSIAGNKVSILAGDFLLSRASVLLSTLKDTEIVEIMAGALEAIMKGQMQLHRPMEHTPVGMDHYVRTLEVRSGNLLACGCQCAAMVAGHDREGPVAKAAFAYGMNLGVAYQIVKDLQVTEANYEKLFNKMRHASSSGEKVKFDPYELNEPLQRAGALQYAADKHPQLEGFVRGGFPDVDALLEARELVIECNALEGVRQRAAYHRDLAIDALASLPASDSKEALVALAHYMTEANQSRLQRKNYDASGDFLQPDEQQPKSGTQLSQVLKDAKKGAKMGMFSMRETLRSFFK